MNAAWQAFGEVLRRNRWIGAALAIGSAVATFLLAGPTVGFIFVIVVLALFLVLTLQLLGSRPAADVNGDASGAVVDPIDVGAPTIDGEEEDEPATADAAQGASAGAAIEPEDDHTGPGMLAVSAALDGDIPRLNEILDEWIANADTSEEKTERKAMGDYLLVHAGDGSALQALRKAVDDGAAPRPRVLNMYANALTIASNPDQAVEALRGKSADFSTEDRAEAVLHAARILHDNDRSGEARELLDEVLDSPSVSTMLRARAWALLGDGQKPTEPIAAAISYERSLELDPSHHGTRFDLAYLYSEINLYLPARLHYLALDSMNRASSTAVNNLAVANEHFGLTAAAYKRYEEAAAAGSALAYANIAHLYLAIGALELAEKAIEAGSAIDPNDGRVISARDRMANMRRDEAKRSKELAPLAQRERAAFRDADVEGPTANLAGVWSRSSGDPVTIAALGDGGFRGQSEDEAFTITLTPVKGAFEATLRLSKYGSSKTGVAFSHADSRVLILIRGYSSAPDQAIVELVRDAISTDDAQLD